MHFMTSKDIIDCQKSNLALKLQQASKTHESILLVFKVSIMYGRFIILQIVNLRNGRYHKVPAELKRLTHTRISLLVLGLNFVFLGTPGMMYSRASWSLIRSSMYSSLQI